MSMNRREMLGTSLAMIPAAVGMGAVACAAISDDGPPTVTRRVVVRDPHRIRDVVGCVTRCGGCLMLIADCRGAWNRTRSAWDVEVTLRRPTPLAIYVGEKRVMIYREVDLATELAW